MTRITIDDAILKQLGKSQKEAEFCDASGRRVGYFVPDEVYRRLMCRWANAQVSDEELEQARRETVSYTTAEVLEHLRNL